MGFIVVVVCINTTEVVIGWMAAAIVSWKLEARRRGVFRYFFSFIFRFLVRFN